MYQNIMYYIAFNKIDIGENGKTASHIRKLDVFNDLNEIFINKLELWKGR